MEKVIKTVLFFSNDWDDFGMPTDYHAYVVIGRGAAQGEAVKGEGIAKVYPLSEQAPLLNPDRVFGPDPDGAVAKAIERLKEVNQDLEFSEDIKTVLY